MSNPIVMLLKESALETVFGMVRAELVKAWTKHPGEFHNAHEGYAVLLEEVDELWADVKADTAYTDAGMKEAVQVAAMAVRFVVELHNHPKGPVRAGGCGMLNTIEALADEMGTRPAFESENVGRSASRVHELLDYATDYGRLNEYSLNSEAGAMSDERRRNIIALKAELLHKGVELSAIVQRHSPAGAE